MRVIELEFESLETIPAAWLFGATGVYVLWAPNAPAGRPTYLGEGGLLHRLGSHVKWLKRGVTGLVARTDAHGSVTTPTAKREAQVAEVLLLEISRHMGIWPSRNKAPGVRARFESYVYSFNVLRLNIRGLHPFRRPGESGSRLDGRAVVAARIGTDDEIRIECPWNRRA